MLEAPEAFIAHHSPHRLRIRIPSRRGDAAFFASVQKVCARSGERPEANPETASLLFVGETAAIDAVAEFGRAQALFDLRTHASPHRPLMHAAVKPVAGLDRSLRLATGGRIDLPSGIFLMLMGFGIYEILRGRFSTPPWYTAFWYAFGLVSMYVIEKGVRTAPDRENAMTRSS
ncbi:MAG: hypothetical protein MUD16_11785 [Desulfobacterales bacterium]|jgi:hypothetical protein|nr:hypothetical protein [Desulfobacterales bacterium]